MRSSCAVNLTSFFFCLGVVVGVTIGLLATDRSLWLKEFVFDAVTAVRSWIAKNATPFELLDLQVTVAACFSSTIAAHLSTFLIAMNVSWLICQQISTEANTPLTPARAAVVQKLLCFSILVRLLLLCS